MGKTKRMTNEQRTIKTIGKKRNKVAISTYLSIIISHDSVLNAPINGWLGLKKKGRGVGYSIYCLQETHFRVKDTHRLRVRGLEKYTSCKWKWQESRGSNTHQKKYILYFYIMHFYKALHNDKGINIRKGYYTH